MSTVSIFGHTFCISLPGYMLKIWLYILYLAADTHKRPSSNFLKFL